MTVFAGVRYSTAFTGLIIVGIVAFSVGYVKGKETNARATIKLLEQAQERNKTIEQELAEVEKKSRIAQETLEIDANSSRNHASRLFKELSRCQSYAPSFEPSDTTGEATGVRTIVLSQIEQRLTTLAEYADRAALAGLTCQAQYAIVKDTK